MTGFDMLTQVRLRELLSYDPATGVFVRLVRSRGCRVGDVAGCRNKNGYVRITVDRKLYFAHRLAWLYVHGAWPVDGIDHINRDPSDNRLANLREATTAENLQNQRIPKNNTSGFIGVSWHHPAKKWQAYIKLNGKNRYLGHFTDPAEAYAAYREAKARLHAFHPHAAEKRAAA